jgi:type VI secretion system secreted protein Hcp
MALNAYLKLRGETHGDIVGSVTQKGREGKIMVIAVAHEIVCPRDVQTGMPSGRSVHKPFYVTKEIDRSSPILYSALTHNEVIADWELQFFQPTPAGLEKQHYTVHLTKATIASIQFRMPNTRNPTRARYVEYEEIGFTYRKISWTWNEGGITGEDDWAAPRM